MPRVATSISFGRLVFFALMIMQCSFLATFLAQYEDENAWYAVTLLFVPAALMWWWINSNTANRLEVVIFWLVYSWLGAVPLISIVFGRLDDKITSVGEGFWNTSTLKLTLCVTPLLFFLLCRSGIAMKCHFSEWSFKALINLFDAIELIAVILDENEIHCSHGISRHFKNTLIAFACISLLWSPVDVYEALQPEATTESDSEVFFKVLSYLIQVLFDTIFLGLRLGLCLGYGRNVSIFINKNIISVIVHCRRICNMFCCSAEDSDTNHPQAEPNESSNPAMPRPAVLPIPTRIINVLRLSNPSATSLAPTAPPPPPYNPYEVR